MNQRQASLSRKYLIKRKKESWCVSSTGIKNTLLQRVDDKVFPVSASVRHFNCQSFIKRSFHCFNIYLNGVHILGNFYFEIHFASHRDRFPAALTETAFLQFLCLPASQSSVQVSEMLSSSENLASDLVGMEVLWICGCGVGVTRCASVLWFTAQWHRSEALNTVE